MCSFDILSGLKPGYRPFKQVSGMKLPVSIQSNNWSLDLNILHSNQLSTFLSSMMTIIFNVNLRQTAI